VLIISIDLPVLPVLAGLPAFASLLLEFPVTLAGRYGDFSVSSVDLDTCCLSRFWSGFARLLTLGFVLDGMLEADLHDVDAFSWFLDHGSWTMDHTVELSHLDKWTLICHLALRT
jgi:hypothetical protein